MPEQPTLPGGTFNLILAPEMLRKLLADEAIYSRVGPFTFFFQLDDGKKPVIHSVAEFREKRGDIHEWVWTRVEPMPTAQKDSDHG